MENWEKMAEQGELKVAQIQYQGMSARTVRYHITQTLKLTK